MSSCKLPDHIQTNTRKVWRQGDFEALGCPFASLKEVLVFPWCRPLSYQRLLVCLVLSLLLANPEMKEILLENSISETAIRCNYIV